MKDSKNYIAYLLFLVGVVLFFSQGQKEASLGEYKQSSIGKSDISSELKSVDFKLRLNEALTNELNERVQAQAQQSGYEFGQKTSSPMRLSNINHAIQVAEENRKEDFSDTYLVKDVDEEILRQVAIQQFSDRYDEIYAKAYINAFLENAREKGLQVVLNQNLEVVEIVPIKMDEPMRFPDSVNTSRPMGGQ